MISRSTLGSQNATARTYRSPKSTSSMRAISHWTQLQMRSPHWSGASSVLHVEGCYVDERKEINAMSEPERYDVLVLGSGTGGKLIAWTMAREGNRTASIERKYVGGACPNIACLPSKNIIHTAKVASLFGRHQEFGIETGAIAVNMAGVYARKRKMVDDLIKVHLDQYQASGAELIWGNARFTGARTLHVAPRDGGERIIAGERVFVNVGTP